MPLGTSQEKIQNNYLFPQNLLQNPQQPLIFDAGIGQIDFVPVMTYRGGQWNQPAFFYAGKKMVVISFTLVELVYQKGAESRSKSTKNMFGYDSYAYVSITIDIVSRIIREGEIQSM